VPPPGAGSRPRREPCRGRYVSCGTSAGHVVLDTKMVASGLPFHRGGRRSRNWIRSRQGELRPPAVVDVGLMEERTGAPFTTCRSGIRGSPAGRHVRHGHGIRPAARTSAAVIVAVRVVDETKVVPRAEPFSSRRKPETKFVPKTVRVKDELPAVVDVGERSSSWNRVQDRESL